MTLPCGSAGSAQVLVVDDHDSTRRSIVRHLEHALPKIRVVGIGTMASARAALSSDLRGAVIDRRLPDGDGLSLVQEIDAVYPGTQRLLVTGVEDVAQSAAAAALCVQIAHKPELAGPLTSFADVLIASFKANARRRRNADAKVSAVAVEILMSSAHLPPSSRRLLELRVGGVPRQSFARALGVEETTVRSQVRAILRLSKSARSRRCTSASKVAMRSTLSRAGMNRCDTVLETQMAAMGRFSRCHVTPPRCGPDVRIRALFGWRLLLCTDSHCRHQRYRA